MEHVVYGFVTAGTLARLGAPSTLDELQLVVGDGELDQEGVRRVAYAVRRNVAALGRRVIDVEVPVPGEHIHSAQMNSLLYTQGAFALMALLLSAFLVVNLISALLVGQSREIEVMKTLGARWPQLPRCTSRLRPHWGRRRCHCTAFRRDRRPNVRRHQGRPAQLRRERLPGACGGDCRAGPRGDLLPVAAAAVPVWHGCRSSVSDALRDVGIASAADPAHCRCASPGWRAPCCCPFAMPFAAACGSP
jgi:putative ABC transport system permease protein